MYLSKDGDNLINRDEKRKALKKLIRFITSSVAAMWVFTIYTMVDGIFVSKGVGPDALAGVNLSMPFINLSFALSILFAIGASAKVSIAKGRGDFQRADRIFTLSTVAVFILSIAVSVIGICNIDRLTLILGAEVDTRQYVKEYLSILLFFDVFYMTSYNLEVLVKADGFPHKAIIYPLIGAFVNIGLDYLFIFTFLWGIKGAAWATGIAQLVSFLLFLAHFISEKSGLSLVKIKLSFREILSMAKVGISDFVTELSMGIVIWAFNMVLMGISGTEGVVVYTVIAYVAQLVLMTMVGLNQGMQPLTGYYYGKNRNDIKRYLFSVSLLVASVLSVIAFILGRFFPNMIVSMFIDEVNEPRIFIHATEAFATYSCAFLPLGITLVISGYFTSLEMAKSAMAISMCRGLIFILPLLFLLSSVGGEQGVWISAPISESMTLISAVILYFVNKRRTDKLN